MKGPPWGWIGYAALLAAAPAVWRGEFALATLSQVAVAIVLCLSFHLLFGEGGMLSFGHAVYGGLGAYLAIHAMRSIGAGTLPLPVSLVPLVGGFGGLGAAAAFGIVATRHGGAPFAMITLGVAELVSTFALMTPGFFGGEAGVSADRVAGRAVLGITFGPQREVYALLAVYAFACTAAIRAFTRTPLGRMLNAVRDDAERVAFVGYDPRRVRYLAFVAAGFFAGVSGGMYAVAFEIATAELLGVARSGAIVVFAFVGGTTVLGGPIVGAVLMVVATSLLSGWSAAWPLWLGVALIAMVIRAPHGIAGLAVGIARGRR